MSEQSTPAPVHTITLDTGEQFPCAEDEKVLIAMERAGRKGIQVGCRGGGCGACRVKITAGDYDTMRMGKNYVDENEAAEGFALACRVLPKSDLQMHAAQKPKEENAA